MVAYVSEPIPLRAALGIEMVLIVVGDPLGESNDLVLKSAAVESRCFGNIQRKTFASRVNNFISEENSTTISPLGVLESTWLT